MKILFTGLVFFILTSFTSPPANDAEFCSRMQYVLDQYTQGYSDAVEYQTAYKAIPGFGEGTTLNYVTRDLLVCDYEEGMPADMTAAYDKVLGQVEGCINKKPKVNTFGEYTEAAFKYKKGISITLTLKKDDYLKLNFERRTK